MPDEVDSQYNRLSALVRELLERQQEVDEKLATDPHAAVKDGLQLQLLFFVEAARYLAAPLAPSSVPGTALVQFLSALDDRERGILNPLLQPKPADRRGGHHLPQMTGLLRVEPAVAMELLMKAGRKKAPAAAEVVRMLGEHHPVFTGLKGKRAALVARWRTEVTSGADPEAKQKFDEWLAFVTTFLRDREGTADDLVRIAGIVLKGPDRYALHKEFGFAPLNPNRSAA